MANCRFLLNDGTSRVVLNDAVSLLLMNDDSCVVIPPVETDPSVETAPIGAGVAWGEHQKTLRRRAQWEADNKRMELLERKKTRISLDVGELRFELKDEPHPGRIKKLQGKINTAMDAIMAIEDELQELYIRMMQ
jgi:hypothetical protein